MKMLEISWWCSSWEKFRWSYRLIEREYWASGEDLLQLQSSDEEQVMNRPQYDREKELMEFEMKHNLRPSQAAQQGNQTQSQKIQGVLAWFHIFKKHTLNKSKLTQLR